MTAARSISTQRSVGSTALLYCEGVHDLTFIRHVMKTYADANRLKARYRTKQGKGGSTDGLAEELLRVPGDFDRYLLKVDKDRDPSEINRAEAIAAARGIIIVWSVPCLEALLLTILDGRDYSMLSSAQCKGLFRKVIPDHKRIDTRAYEKQYTLAVIEKARKTIPELNQIVEFIAN